MLCFLDSGREIQVVGQRGRYGGGLELPVWGPEAEPCPGFLQPSLVPLLYSYSSVYTGSDSYSYLFIHKKNKNKTKPSECQPPVGCCRLGRACWRLSACNSAPGSSMLSKGRWGWGQDSVTAASILFGQVGNRELTHMHGHALFSFLHWLELEDVVSSIWGAHFNYRDS